MAERIELHTERLLLRPFALDDVDDVLAYAADGEWGRYLPVPMPYTRRDAEEFVGRAIDELSAPVVTFALVLDGRVVGGVNLRIDSDNAVAELGYSLARDYWGRGLTPEAARAVMHWGFRVFDLEKVYARADARNVRSWRVMEKLGMQREALLRAHRLEHGERTDELWYGLLRLEWEQQLGRPFSQAAG